MSFISTLKIIFPPQKGDINASSEFDKREKEIDIEDKENQVKRRETYFKILTFSSISWLIFTMCIVCANGAEDDWLKFSTSDSIVIALIGSSVLPPLTLIGKSLFRE